MKKYIFLALFCLSLTYGNCQKSDFEQIQETLQQYIEGSTNGKPHLLEKAFHKDLNLYYTKNDSLKTWAGSAYIMDTKEGKPTGEYGEILTIDFENDAGMAKVKIDHPKSKYYYIDYFMLLKVNGKWTIVHKMFTPILKSN